MSRGDVFDYLADGPFCLVALDPSTGRPTQVNETFTKQMGPLYKFQGYEFAGAATDEEEHQDKLSKAIKEVVSGGSGCKKKARVRNVEMVTLAGEAGLPIRVCFDWTVGKGADGHILLFGDRCTEEDVHQREKDAELIDFFQKAPIALHWLSGEGIVLWANQTELNVLGYTAEEYIGQPIMKFCPDEEELVLHIFKQLGSGNIIKDVPVRFRTKEGKLVHLLIDSNVKYDKNGNFGHTRCFIRDDTGRKIRDAKAKLLIEETKRSLKMLDNFMSRSLHHMRTALHVLHLTCDFVSTNLEERVANGTATEDDEESLMLLKSGSDHVSDACEMIRDITDLNRFDQGAVFELGSETFELKSFGAEVLDEMPEAGANVEVALELGGGGPASITSDRITLKRILRRLLENAVEAATEGTITLRIMYKEGCCVFAVIDSGPGIALEQDVEGNDGNLPSIFQRYHQEVIPAEEQLVDFEKAVSIRQKIEAGLSSHRKNGLGIGLSLSYHLVLALGGDLRFSSRPGMTKFWFSLSPEASSPAKLEDGRFVVQANKTMLATPRKPMLLWDGNMSLEAEAASKLSIARKGLKAMDRACVLVVEDTDMCAEVLCQMLTKSNCSSRRAANGKEAIYILTSATPGMFDLVLMDLRMPVMDGIEATRMIKNELKLDIPVIALTGDAGADMHKQCNEVGFDGFFQKPLKPSVLKQILDERTAIFKDSSHKKVEEPEHGTNVTGTGAAEVYEDSSNKNKKVEDTMDGTTVTGTGGAEVCEDLPIKKVEVPEDGTHATGTGVAELCEESSNKKAEDPKDGTNVTGTGAAEVCEDSSNKRAEYPKDATNVTGTGAAKVCEDSSNEKVEVHEVGSNVTGNGAAATTTSANKTMLENPTTHLPPPPSGLKQPRVSQEGSMPLEAPVSSKARTVCKDRKAGYRASILVVEDTDMCAKLLYMMLNKSSCSSRRAVNGKEAIDILQNATPGTFGLILMDLRMPVMGGIEATRIIKNELKLNIPVIALTGDGGADMRKQCNEIGFDGFFQKPLKHSVLKQILDERAQGYEAS